MKNYNIAIEINLQAENPKKAAQEFYDWLVNGYGPIMVVQDENTGELFSVDLGECDDDMLLPLEVYEPLIVNK